jgi:hypothetical protein
VSATTPNYSYWATPEAKMTKTPMFHLEHPTDTRRTIGGHWVTACGRWAGFKGFLRIGNRAMCPKCAAAQLIHETALPEVPRDA